jgi:hypothetical protein
MVICHFWIIIVKDNENWLLVFKNSDRRGFLALGSYGKIITGPMEGKRWPPWPVCNDVIRGRSESDVTDSLENRSSFSGKDRICQ